MFTSYQKPFIAVDIVPMAGVGVLRIPAPYQPLIPVENGSATTIDHLKCDLEPERGISF